jgi:hypothetical protein
MAKKGEREEERRKDFIQKKKIKEEENEFLEFERSQESLQKQRSSERRC